MTGPRRDDDLESRPTEAPAPSDAPWEAANGEAAASKRISTPTATPQGLTYTVYGRTDVGLVREHNEDNLLVAELGSEAVPLPSHEESIGQVSERGLALAVCDGMGGAAAGEVASQMAVNALFEVLRGEDPPIDRDAFARRLVEAVEEAGTRIYNAAKKDRTRRGMGTTATVAGLIDKVLFVAQVGDSRCYLLRKGRLYLLTKDQSLVNQLIEAGQLTEDEAEAFEHSNIILQALGTTEKVSVDLTFVELRRGDRLLVCSDGLSGLVHSEVIEEEMACIASLDRLAERLIELANVAGGHDNITCIVADFDGEDLPEPDDVAPFYQQYPLPRPDKDDEPSFRPPVIKSMLPRPMPAVRKVLRDRAAEANRAKRMSIGSAAAVALLFGLLAFLAVTALDESPSSQLTIAVDQPPPPVYVDADAPVEVRVSSSVEDGHLYVNGRNYGPIPSGEPVLLELIPGAYQFEARKGEAAPVAAVVLVEPGLPRDVLLTPSRIADEQNPELEPQEER
jgi:serine/threonine protein phosphatase PrpC